VAQQYDLLVGADGAGSEVRKALQQHYPDMQVTVDDSGREYKVYGGVRGDIEPEGGPASTAHSRCGIEVFAAAWHCSVCH
jgi:2-polyprenyl-6-methoxyphenol hydroxylase-like FAD-dependent oxidoreductase